MILVERVASFLRSHLTGSFCDECLKERLDVSKAARVTAVTEALGNSSEFDLRMAECSFCLRDRRTIHAKANSHTHPLDLLRSKAEMPSPRHDDRVCAPASGPDQSALSP